MAQQPINQEVYQILQEVAREGKIIYYADLIRRANLDIDLDSDFGRWQIGQVLEAISRYTYNQCQLLLSAVVIREDTGKPGQGFFNLAKELKGYDGEDDDAFHVRELKRVHRYWQGR